MVFCLLRMYKRFRFCKNKYASCVAAWSKQIHISSHTSISTNIRYLPFIFYISYFPMAPIISILLVLFCCNHQRRQNRNQNYLKPAIGKLDSIFSNFFTFLQSLWWPYKTLLTIFHTWWYTTIAIHDNTWSKKSMHSHI